MEKTEDYIEQQLKKINRVEPSPFLWTRIEAQLESNSESAVFQPRLALAALVFLVVINALAISVSMSGNLQTGSNGLLNELNIKTSNQLYHE